MNKTLLAIRAHRLSESNTVVKHATLDSWTDAARERGLALDTQSNQNAILAYQIGEGNAKRFFGYWDNKAQAGWIDNKPYGSVRDLFSLVAEAGPDRLSAFRARAEGNAPPRAPAGRQQPADRNPQAPIGEAPASPMAAPDTPWAAPATSLKKGDHVEFVAADFRKGLRGTVTGPGVPGYWAIDMEAGRHATEYAKPEEVKILSIAMEAKATGEATDLSKWETEDSVPSAEGADGGSNIPGYGSPFICTSSSQFIADRTGGDVMGFDGDDNPGSSLGQLAGGHDFVVVDGRYIIDWWARFIEGETDRTVFDMQDPAQAEAIASLYGDPTTWDKVSGPKPFTEASSVSVEELSDPELAEVVEYLQRQQIGFEQDREKKRLRFDARDQEVVFDIIDEIQSRPESQMEAWAAAATAAGLRVAPVDEGYSVAVNEDGAVVGDYDEEEGSGSLTVAAEDGEHEDAGLYASYEEWATDAKATFPDGQLIENPDGSAEWRAPDGVELWGEFDPESGFGWVMNPVQYAGEATTRRLKRLKWRRIVQQEAGEFPADKMAPRRYKLLVYPPGVGHNQSGQWMALWRDLSPENVGVQGLGKDREAAIADLKAKRDLPNA
jgi:hypothetical protein